ncbi:polynucleotide adenylyltransferase PcnB [Kaarinaea lacus]
MIEEATNNSNPPTVVHSDDLGVSLLDISQHALKVIHRLREAHFEAYLVGGGVRDLLLGRKPKDFDIATNALPDQAHAQFRNSRLIGRRFRLLHVHFGREIIEVATFRGNHNNGDDADRHNNRTREGMIVRDNIYGTMKEDAWRRDFTVNALYFCPQKNEVVDYTGGLQDLESRVLRVIGDAQQRYTEDPVRMLRAIRFAAKLDFTLHPDSEAPVAELAPRLTAVPAARLFDEVLKLFLTGKAVKTFELLQHYGLFEPLFPVSHDYLQDKSSIFYQMVLKALQNTDDRIHAGKPVTPGFLFAVFLWQPMLDLAEKLQSKGLNLFQSHQSAGAEVIARQGTHVSLPKRFALQAKEIWALQPRLPRRAGHRAFRLVEHPRFRAAYDFMLLRAEAGQTELQPLCDWWTTFQEKNHHDQLSMVQEIQSDSRRRKRPRRRKKADSKK